jgi:tetratricopeptide (TPR) repeat protein
MNKEVVVHDIVEYINYIKHINSEEKHYGSFIYRGQSNHSWKLTSGAYRRIEEGKKSANYLSLEVTSTDILDYMHEKLNEVRKRIPMDSYMNKLNEIDLLVEMQHFGGATNFIDFSRNSLVALYFAVADNVNEKGKIFCINANTAKIKTPPGDNLKDIFPIQNEGMYSYNPTHNNFRVIKQDSIFLFDNFGIMPDSFIDCVIVVEAVDKKKILQELSEVVGISDEQMYPDYMGYLQANSFRKPHKIKSAIDYFNEGSLLWKAKNYKDALRLFDKSLQIDPNQHRTLLYKATCLKDLKNYIQALDVCDAARKIEPNDFDSQNVSGIVYTYLNRLLEAGKCFEMAKRLAVAKTEIYSVRNNIAWMNIRGGRLDEAEAVLKEILDENNPYHQYINLGHIYLIRKDENKAIEYYVDCMKCATNMKEFVESYESDFEGVNMEAQEISREYYLETLRSKIEKKFNEEHL